MALGSRGRKGLTYLYEREIRCSGEGNHEAPNSPHPQISRREWNKLTHSSLTKLYAPERKEQESYKTHRCTKTHPMTRPWAFPRTRACVNDFQSRFQRNNTLQQLCITCFERFVQFVWVLWIILRKIHQQTQKLHSNSLHSLSLRIIANDKNRLPCVLELLYVYKHVYLGIGFCIKGFLGQRNSVRIMTHHVPLIRMFLVNLLINQKD